jgi:hypothetical protein
MYTVMHIEAHNIQELSSSNISRYPHIFPQTPHSNADMVSCSWYNDTEYNEAVNNATVPVVGCKNKMNHLDTHDQQVWSVKSKNKALVSLDWMSSVSSDSSVLTERFVYDKATRRQCCWCQQRIDMNEVLLTQKVKQAC